MSVILKVIDMFNMRILLGVLLGALMFNNAIADGVEETKLSSKGLQRLTSVVNKVKKYYHKPVAEDVLIDKAIRGMLSGLDPHSDYLDADNLNELDMLAYGKFGGIGVEVYPDLGAIRVISPIDDTPAYRAGIKSGDYIVQINNKIVREMTVIEAVRMMRGKPGSKLTLTIIRKNEAKPLVVKLYREIIKIKTVKSRVLAPGYGYVRLALFQESTERDMVREIERLKKESKNKMKGLVLDLRNNSGGLVESALQITDDLLDANTLKNNKLLLSYKGQDEEVQATASAGGDILKNIPLVVLINEGSASASEIVAGALQDYKRAIIVGERSFGKGSMQRVIPLDDSTAIKLTTALYYTPLGRSIQAKGIEPDISVESLQIARDNKDEKNIPRTDEAALVDHIQNGDDADGSIAAKLGDEQQRQSKADRALAHKDYQLYSALNVLKVLSVMKSK